MAADNASGQSLFEQKLEAQKIRATNIKNPIILVTILFSILVFFLPRDRLFIPFIVAACFIPTDQRIILYGLDFTVLRILIIVAMARIFFYKKRKPTMWCRFDFIIIWWALSSSVVYIMLWGTLAAVTRKCGNLLDVLGIYWLFRYNIRSWDDIFLALKTLAVCSVVMTFFVIPEWATGKNPFSILGRVTTPIRGGKFRCQASFPHPIIMGLYWTALFPLFIGMAKIIKRDKVLYVLAAVGCVVSIMASNSSTTIGGLLIVSILLFSYGWRYKVKLGVVITFATLIALHLIMNIRSGMPIWHLLARLNITGKSVAWHRFNLFDQFVRRFDEWWLLGMKSTAHWDPWGRLSDVTNQYVFEGVRGGLLGLVLFLTVLANTFWCLVRHFQTSNIASKEQLLAWYIWVSFMGYLAAFFAVSYFGQISVLWYFQLAITGFIYRKQLSTGINSSNQVKNHNEK